MNLGRTARNCTRAWEQWALSTSYFIHTGTDQRPSALAGVVMDQHTHLLAYLALKQLPRGTFLLYSTSHWSLMEAEPCTAAPCRCSSLLICLENPHRIFIVPKPDHEVVIASSAEWKLERKPYKSFLKVLLCLWVTLVFPVQQRIYHPFKILVQFEFDMECGPIFNKDSLCPTFAPTIFRCSHLQ